MLITAELLLKTVRIYRCIWWNIYLWWKWYL